MMQSDEAGTRISLSVLGHMYFYFTAFRGTGRRSVSLQLLIDKKMQVENSGPAENSSSAAAFQKTSILHSFLFSDAFFQFDCRIGEQHDYSPLCPVLNRDFTKPRNKDKSTTLSCPDRCLFSGGTMISPRRLRVHAHLLQTVP